MVGMKCKRTLNHPFFHPPENLGELCLWVAIIDLRVSKAYEMLFIRYFDV